MSAEPTLSHRIEAAAARGLFAWSRRQGVDRASARFGWLARRLGPRLKSVHRRGLANLALTMPEAGAARHEEILLDAWENLGRTAAEYAHLPALRDRVEVVGGERLAAQIGSGRPAVFVSGHFANWEVMPLMLHALGLRYAAVYRPANNPLVDGLIAGLRGAVMSPRLIPKGKRGGRALIAAVREDYSICMLTDQKLNDGIDAPLLGVSCRTAPAAARLALRSKLPCYPLQLVRTQGARFRLTIHPPLGVEETGDAKADTLALTVAINDSLGRFIEETPGQWLWFHRRWPREARPASA